MLSPAEVRRLVGPSCPQDDREVAELTQQLYAIAEFTVDLASKRRLARSRRVRSGPLLRLVPRERLEEVEERAAIREFEGGQNRVQAERGALGDLRTSGRG